MQKHGLSYQFRRVTSRLVVGSSSILSEQSSTMSRLLVLTVWFLENTTFLSPLTLRLLPTTKESCPTTVEFLHTATFWHPPTLAASPTTVLLVPATRFSLPATVFPCPAILFCEPLTLFPLVSLGLMTQNLTSSTSPRMTWTCLLRLSTEVGTSAWKSSNNRQRLMSQIIRLSTRSFGRLMFPDVKAEKRESMSCLKPSVLLVFEVLGVVFAGLEVVGVVLPAAMLGDELGGVEFAGFAELAALLVGFVALPVLMGFEMFVVFALAVTIVVVAPFVELAAAVVVGEFINGGLEMSFAFTGSWLTETEGGVIFTADASQIKANKVIRVQALRPKGTQLIISTLEKAIRFSNLESLI